MKQVKYYLAKMTLTLIALFTLQNAFAQEKVDVNGHDVGSWFSTHWMWVVGGVLLLIVLLLIGDDSSKKRRTTTIERDENGQVRNVTTTERID